MDKSKIEEQKKRILKSIYTYSTLHGLDVKANVTNNSDDSFTITIKNDHNGKTRVRSCLLPLYSRITKVINQHNGSKGQDLTLVPIHKPVCKQTAYASLYWNNVNQNNHQFLLR